MRTITYREAITEALQEEMIADETVFIIGQFVTNEPFGTHKGLYNKFGKDRLMDTAISENAIVGSCVGAALAGYRPIARLDFVEFFMVAANEISGLGAKWRFMHGGTLAVPLVMRVSMGGYYGLGPEHSQCNESFFMHTPGLKLIVPATPYDAKGLLKTAIRDNNPVIMLEHKRLFDLQGEVPEGEYTVPFGVADVKKKGSDITVVATGFMVPMCLDVAAQLEQQGISVEVVDPRTLEPLDMDTILKSVRKTGKVIVVDEDTQRCGVAAEICMQILEGAHDSLVAAPIRISAANSPIPGGVPLEQFVLPQPQDVADAIGRVMNEDEPLPVRDLGQGVVDMTETMNPC